MTIGEMEDHLSVLKSVIEKWLKRLKREEERETLELKRRLIAAEAEFARLKREMNWPRNITS